jgi:hypothetical protein
MKNLFLLGALLIPTIVYSANDLERWNSEVGRTVRQAQSEKLAQTTYSEISSKMYCFPRHENRLSTN